MAPPRRPSIADLIAAGPGVAPAQSGFIGVPGDYVASVPAAGPPSPKFGPPTVGRPPSFKDGAQYAPASMSSERIAQLQNELKAAGAYAPKASFRIGIWTEADVRAYERVLGFANAAGISDVKQAVKRFGEAPPEEDADGDGPSVIGGKVGGGATDVIRLSDPAALRARADKIGQAVLGRKLNDEQRGRLVRTLMSEEADPQRRVNAADESQRRATFGAQVGAESDQAIAAAAAGQGAGAPMGPSGEVAIDPALAAFIAAAPGKITVGGKVRTTAQQAKLYADKPGLAAKPGHSKHETGEAADLVFEGGHGGKVAQWAHANAAKFGLSFPMLSRAKGKKFEPWHVELPGKRGSHAKGRVPGGAAGPTTAGVVSTPNTYIPTVTTTIGDVDPDARLEEAIRAEAPAEAGAHDVSTQFQRMIKMLGSPV